MRQRLRHNPKRVSRSARVVLLAALALWWAGLGTAAGWALDTPAGERRLDLAQRLQVTSSGAPESVAPELAQLDLSEALKTPVTGRMQLDLGRARSLKVAAFTYLGSGAGLRAGVPTLGLAAMPAAPGTSAGLAASAGRRDRAQDDRATFYQLGFTTGPLQMAAQFADVGARFALTEETLKQHGGEEAVALKQATGTRNVSLEAALKLSPAASLTSSHTSLRNDRPEDEKQGLTTTDTAHVFALALGPATRMQASLKEHSETWDPGRGHSDVARRTSAVELESRFGAEGQHGLRMALTNVASRQDGKETETETREVHLNLAPTSRLKLSADHVSKDAGQGNGSATRQVSAVMQLAPGAEVGATVKTIWPEGKEETQHSTFRLATGLGKGRVAGNLVAERTVVAAPDAAGNKSLLKTELTGALMTGLGRANLRAALQEDRGVGPEGNITRVAQFHVDGPVAPRVTISADREERITGTNQEPVASAKSTYAVVSELGPKTKLTANLSALEASQGDEQSGRDVVLEHEAGGLKVRAQSHLVRAGQEDRTAESCALDAPQGVLAEWAQTISHGHEFEDAGEYRASAAPAWLDMPFAGFRVWHKQLRGGPDDGMDTTGFAHRRMLGPRLHLLLASQEHPEATDGDRKGRPLPLRRSLAELGAALRPGLVAHLRLTQEDSTLDGERSVDGIALGVRGRLSALEQLEASVSRDRGTWDNAAREQTAVSLMWGLKVSDQHRVSLKGCYSWGDQESGDRDRSYRVSLGYEKPI